MAEGDFYKYIKTFGVQKEIRRTSLPKISLWPQFIILFWTVDNIYKLISNIT